MARLITFDIADTLLQTWQDVVALEHKKVAVVACLSEYAFDNHVIGDCRPGLRSGRTIGQQRVHCARKFFVEQGPITSGVIVGEVTVFVCYLVEETTEEFS